MINIGTKALLLQALLIGCFAKPALPVSAFVENQETQPVTATGEWCNYQNSCGSITFQFFPEGGEVTGTFSGSLVYESDDPSLGHVVATINEEGTLTGTFSGGDGGTIEGTFTMRQVSGSQFFQGQSHPIISNSYSGTWKGTLSNDGQGNGTYTYTQPLNNSWKVTFPAGVFDPKTETTAPTPDEPTLEAIQPDTDEKDPWVWSTSVTERMHSWIEIDQAVAEILGQDGALIARDQDDNFYVVDNEGNRKPLPAELLDALQVENSMALLGNRDLLQKNPTIQALVAKEGEGILNSIDGSGEYQFFSLPDWVKQRQYFWLMTQCHQGVCRGYARISIARSSGYIDASALGSSEHASVRGTINGGGDFIYAPKPLLAGALILSAFQPGQNEIAPAYLGAEVKNRADGAEVLLVQAGSPAEISGILVGDLIANVSGKVIDSQTTLTDVLADFSGGEEVILGLVRNGEVLTVNTTLAVWQPAVIETPAAVISTGDDTRLVYDIGLNGITAILVLEGSALVNEPVTGTEVEVSRGQALIVVPGEAVGEPFSIDESDLNQWWKNPQESTRITDATTANPSLTGHKEFNPLPGANEETLYWLVCIGLGLIYLILFLVKLTKKS